MIKGILTADKIKVKLFMRKGWLFLGILFLSSILGARGFDWAVEDSLRSIHPRMRARWLRTKGIEDPYYFKPFVPDSQNVRCVGRWSYGPSYEITGKIAGNETYLFLSRGSGVSVLRFQGDPLRIELLSDINASGLVMQAVVKDTLLFLGCYDFGIEIYNISNLQNPRRVSWIITSQNDFFVKDTLLYLIGNDTFKVFNIANPLNPNLLGQVADSGYSIYVSGNYAYLGDRWGLYILDISNPRNMRRINTLSGGAQIGAIWVENNLCYYTVTYPEGIFIIADVSNPNNPFEVGRLNNISGGDIYKINYFLYLPGLDIIDVSNPPFPVRISYLGLPGWENGVWVNNPFGRAFVADDWEGLQVINISDPTNPQAETSLLKGDYSYDVVVDRNYAYVANYACGLKIIDISNPTFPSEIGAYDTVGRYPILFWTATAKDSFAYGGFWEFRVIDITDPHNPRTAAICDWFNPAKDIVIRDSFVYVAEDGKFEIFNVANPRQPRLVGRCNLPTGSADLCIQSNFAYITPDLHIVNISNPSNPILVSRTPCNAWGIDVRDTFAFISHAYESLLVYSVANPLAPYKIGWAPLHGQGYDVVLRDNFAFVGCYDFRVFDITDPTHPQLVGYYTTPDRVRRVFADSEYVYAACFSAGVCIFEYVSTGIEENLIERRGVSDFSIIPNPVGPRCYLNLTGIANRLVSIKIYNIAGQKLKEFVLEKPEQINKYKQEISLKGLPDGVLFFNLKQGTKDKLIKVTKVTRR